MIKINNIPFPVQCAFIAVLLSLTATTTTSSSSSNCITNLNDIVLPEIELAKQTTSNNNNNAILDERIYILCPNTIFTIGIPESPGSLNYTGGSLPLVIFNPHLTVQCGDSGKFSNNCILDGGIHQVIAVGRTALPSELSQVVPDASDFQLKGVTLRNSKDITFSIAVHGTNIRITDCLFDQQTKGEFVLYLDSPEAPIPVQRTLLNNNNNNHQMNKNYYTNSATTIHVTLDHCTFQNHQVTVSVVGAIGTVNTIITSSQFTNNTIIDSGNGLGSLLWFTEGSGTLQDNCMVDNQYTLSSTLVNRGTFNVSGNYAHDKTRFQTIGCNDYLFVTKGETLGNALKNGLFVCENFDSQECLIKSNDIISAGCHWQLAGRMVPTGVIAMTLGLLLIG